jgi:hypothetical protein
MNHQSKSFRSLAAQMAATVLCFLASSSARAWSLHLGPIKNGGNCCTIIFNCEGYLDGIRDSQHLVFHQGGAIAPLGVWPNATGSDFSAQDLPGHTVVFYCTIDDAGAGCNQSASSPDTPVGAGGSAAFEGTVGGSIGNCSTNMCLSTNETFSWTVQNQGNSAALFWVLLDGARQCGTFNSGGGTGMGMMLEPGQSGTLTTPVQLVGCNSGNDGNFTLQQVDVAGQWTDGGNCSTPNGPAVGPTYAPTTITPIGGSGGTVTVGGGTGATGGGSGSGTTGTTYSPTNTSPITYNPTNSPGGTNPPTDGTMQEGFSALYDAINRNGANTVEALSAVQLELISHRAIYNGMSNVMGQVLVSVNSNGNLQVQYQASVSNSMARATNLLTASLGVQSNALMIASNTLMQLSNTLVFNTNAFANLSNSVVQSGGNITNILGWNISSNLANAAMLSNVVQGVSNAVVTSGTNLGAFLSNSFAAVMGNLTNLNFTGGTNGFSDAGITNAVAGEHADVTNLLGQLLHATTNEVANTNEGAIASLLPGPATNGAAALDAGNAAAADAIAGAQGAIDGIGSAPTMGDGAMPDLDVTIGDFTLNVSPENIAPGIGPALKAMITVVALLGFAFSAGKLFWEATRTYAQAQTGGVPNLDGEVAGFGGNILGVAAAVAVPVVFIGIWIAVFTGLVGLMTGRLSELTGSTFGLPNALAMNMLRAVFPVDLILSLAWTRVVLQFTAGKLVLISASASRYLFGR